MKLKLCLGSSCFARGNSKIQAYLEKYLATEAGADLELSVCLCQNKCEHGPNLTFNGRDYEGVTVKKLRELLEGGGDPAPGDA